MICRIFQKEEFHAKKERSAAKAKNFLFCECLKKKIEEKSKKEKSTMNKFFEGLKSTVSLLSKKRQLEEKLKLQGVVNLESEGLEEIRKNMFRTSMPIPLLFPKF